MREFINLIEDVMRNLELPDPSPMEFDKDMTKAASINGIDVYSKNTDDGYAFLFLKPDLKEFFFDTADVDGDPRIVGECVLYRSKRTANGKPCYGFMRINLAKALRGKGFGYQFYKYLLSTGMNLITEFNLTKFSFAIWKKLSVDPAVTTWYYDTKGKPHAIAGMLDDTRNRYPSLYASTTITQPKPINQD